MIAAPLLLVPLALTPLQENLGDPSVILPDSNPYVHRFIEWPTSAPGMSNWEDAGPFGASAAGNLTHTGVSAVFMRDNGLFMLEGFETVMALCMFNGRTSADLNNVKGVAVIQREGPFGFLDLLVTADGKNGLMQHAYSGATAAPDFTSSSFDTSAEAKQADYLVTADLDEDDGGLAKDLLCVSGDKVLVFRLQGGAWVQGTTITASGPIGRAIACDYDGLIGLEIVTMTNPIRVYSLNGTLLASITIPGTVTAITSVPPMPPAGPPPHSLWEISDRLVIAYEDPTPKLQVRSSNGTTQDPLVLLSSPYEVDQGVSRGLEVRELVPVDVNRDGRTDVVVVQESVSALVGLVRRADGDYSMDEADVERIPFEAERGTEECAGNVGRPVVWNAGPYARNTYVCPVETLGRGADDMTGVAITTTRSTVSVDDSLPGSIGDSGGPELRVMSYGDDGKNFRIRLSPPVGTTVIEDHTFVQVQYWREKLDGTLDAVGGHGWYPIDDPVAGTTDRYVIDFSLSDIKLEQPASPTPPVAAASAPADRVYWFDVRIIEADVEYDGDDIESAEILDESEWAHFAMRMEPSFDETPGPYYDEDIKSLPDVTAIKRLFDLDPPTGGGVEFGVVVVRPMGGTFSVGELPYVAFPPHTQAQ